MSVGALQYKLQDIQPPPCTHPRRCENYDACARLKMACGLFYRYATPPSGGAVKIRAGIERTRAPSVTIYQYLYTD